MSNKLAIVVPCYKEEAVLHETTKRLSDVLNLLVAKCQIDNDSFILYVNDGSTDQTWPIILQLHKENKYVCGVNLACNVGHQNALWAGLTVAVEHADMVVSIDADLQDDVCAIVEMVDDTMKDAMWFMECVGNVRQTHGLSEQQHLDSINL